MNEEIKTQIHDYGLLAMRLVIGLIFVISGFGKLGGLEGFGGFLTSLGIPLSGVFAVVVPIVELVGGLWLLSGWNIRWPSLALATIIFVAILTAHLSSWNEVRYPLLLFVTLVFFSGHKPRFAVA